MSRIPKNHVNAALSLAAQNIVAAGHNGVTSRADMERKLETLSGTEKALTDRLFRFIVHRDFKTNAGVMKSDVQRALDYAREKLVEKYDLNNNGLSKSEVAKMSVTGQLAVKLAAETRGITAPLPKSSSTALAGLIATAVKDTWYVSESDSQPTFVEAKLPRGATVDGATVFKAFQSQLEAAFDEQDGDLKEYTFSVESPNFLTELIADYKDPSLDPYYHDNARGFERLKQVLVTTLQDVVTVRVGPRDSTDPRRLATDSGAYQYLLVGKSADGKLAGVMFESVET